MATTKSKKKKSRKAPPSGKGLTFEKVWASLQETNRIIKENAELQRKVQEENAELQKKKQEEYDELQRKRQEENAERQKKIERENEELRLSIKETERIVRRNGKQMGDLHRRFGQLAEHLVAPGIFKRFNELGYHFGAFMPKGEKIIDYKTYKIKTEVDLLLENGNTIMAVEVKIRPVVQDIEHHIKRLEILRDHRRTVNDQRKVQGAIAGAIFEDDVKEAVREAGLYVIEQSGDTMKIDMPEDFIPREW